MLTLFLCCFTSGSTHNPGGECLTLSHLQSDHLRKHVVMILGALRGCPSPRLNPAPEQDPFPFRSEEGNPVLFNLCFVSRPHLQSLANFKKRGTDFAIASILNILSLLFFILSLPIVIKFIKWLLQVTPLTSKNDQIISTEYISRFSPSFLIFSDKPLSFTVLSL